MASHMAAVSTEMTPVNSFSRPTRNGNLSDNVPDSQISTLELLVADYSGHSSPDALQPASGNGNGRKRKRTNSGGNKESGAQSKKPRPESFSCKECRRSKSECKRSSPDEICKGCTRKGIPCEYDNTDMRKADCLRSKLNSVVETFLDSVKDLDFLLRLGLLYQQKEVEEAGKAYEHVKVLMDSHVAPDKIVQAVREKDLWPQIDSATDIVQPKLITEALAANTKPLMRKATKAIQTEGLRIIEILLGAATLAFSELVCDMTASEIDAVVLNLMQVSLSERDYSLERLSFWEKPWDKTGNKVLAEQLNTYKERLNNHKKSILVATVPYSGDSDSASDEAAVENTEMMNNTAAYHGCDHVLQGNIQSAAPSQSNNNLKLSNPLVL